jgi:glycosyltransferase involved in cell wall biosynthesis
MNKGISFIIPVYNGALTISEAVFSIINTNFNSSDEIIIVDDGSTDDTVEVVKKIQSQNPNIVKLFQHEKNQGGAAARNTAVRNASNEFIFCLDSDNLLMPHSINLLLDHMISTSGDIASFGEVLFFRSNKKRIIKKWIFVKNQVDICDALVSGINPISSGNYLYKKETWSLIGGYPLNSRALDAWSFGLKQLASNFKINVLHGVGYFHRVGHESYWVRESNNNEISHRAVDFILGNPQIQLDNASFLYLSTKEGRDTWMKNGIAKPLKLLNREFGTPGILKICEPWFLTVLFRFFNKFLRR